MIKRLEYEAGEIIIKENEEGATAYMIETGRVEISKAADGETVLLASLGEGEIFGEMGMIEDKPRSATVTAVEKTVVREIHRNAFLESLQTDPDVSIQFLKVLFERLRESHVKILQLQQAVSTHPSEAIPPREDKTGASQLAVSLEGLTPVASRALPENPFHTRKFPFLIGRKSRDPLAYNDLRIPDEVPLQISRHHIDLITQDGRIGAVDRGSYLGSFVDGRPLGGPEAPPGPLFFEEPEGRLVLGNSDSLFKFRVVKVQE